MGLLPPAGQSRPPIGSATSWWKRHEVTVKFLHLAVLVQPLAGAQKNPHHLASLLDSIRHDLLVRALLVAIDDRHLLVHTSATADPMHRELSVSLHDAALP